jgi:tight adherence protein B
VLTEWLAAVCVVAAIIVPGRPRPAARLAETREDRARLLPASPLPARWLVAVAAGSGLVAMRVSAVLLGVLAVAAVVVRRVQRAKAAEHARWACELAVVEVTVALAGELRAGRTSAEALAAVSELAGPLRGPIRAAYAAVVLGADPADELARAAAMPGAGGLRGVAAAWTVATVAGGRVAAVLERLSESMDSDIELRHELAAAMAGPRATMVLLGTLPALGVALGQAVGAHPLRLLIHRPAGWALLAAASLLDLLGLVLTRAIARVASRG